MTVEQRLATLEKMAALNQNLNHTLMDMLKQTQIIIDANNEDIDDFADRLEKLENRIAVLEEVNIKNIGVISALAKIIDPGSGKQGGNGNPLAN